MSADHSSGGETSGATSEIGHSRMSRPRVVVSSYLGGIPEHEQQMATTSLARSTCLFIEPKARNPRTDCHRLDQITGPTGSIRGHRDVVRRSLENLKLAKAKNFPAKNLETFLLKKSQTIEEETSYLDYLVLREQGLCVLYTTTLGIIRRTFEESKKMRAILQLNFITFEERDIYLNQEYRNQLRLRSNLIHVPSLYIDGKYFGSLRDLEQINETGELKRLLARFKMPIAVHDVCRCCGDARFIACQSCNGSRKSTVHHFKLSSVTLRCIQCDQNGGLVRCPVCSPKLDS